MGISTRPENLLALELTSLVLTFVCSSQAQTPRPNVRTDLVGTSWQLLKFQGNDGKSLTPDDKTKYTIAFGGDSRMSVRIDCNRGTGTWKSSEPNQIQFGPLALTRAMCPPGALNDKLPKDLNLVQAYTIRDRHLLLTLADKGTYEFEPFGEVPPEETGSAVSSKGPISYGCTQTGGRKASLTATFYSTTPALVLVEWGNRTRPAFQVRAASGAKYEAKDLMFWDAHGEAAVTWSGIELKCKPR